MVATPDIIIASCGFRPISSGKTNVAPNIATTCWAPSPTVLPHESRSCGGDHVAWFQSSVSVQRPQGHS